MVAGPSLPPLALLEEMLLKVFFVPLKKCSQIPVEANLEIRMSRLQQQTSYVTPLS